MKTMSLGSDFHLDWNEMLDFQVLAYACSYDNMMYAVEQRRHAAELDPNSEEAKLLESKARASVERANEDVLRYLVAMHIGSSSNNANGIKTPLDEIFPEGIENVTPEDQIVRFMRQSHVKSIIQMFRKANS